MRLFSRIGSFFRADRPAGAAPGAASGPSSPSGLASSGLSEDPIAALEADPRPAARLPSASAESFKRRLLSAVETARRAARAGLYTLDPSVQILVIPHKEAKNAREEERLGDEIDAAIKQIESGGRLLSSVTWSALKDARPTFEPTYVEWAGDQREALDGEVGIIFFVDMDAIAISMSHAATSLGLASVVDSDGSVVRISDGRYEAHVGVSALLAEALWTARGPLAVIMRRAGALPAELRSFQALAHGLERRFPGARVEHRDSALFVEGEGARGRVDYRRMAAAQRAAGLSVDAWLARARLVDLVEDGAEPSVLVRAPAFARARPDALTEERDGVLLCAVRESDGRAAPVLRRDDDPPGRFAHYADEAARQLAFFKFVGHAYVLDQPGGRAVVFVGDKAASLTFHASLLRGALEQLIPLEPRMKVRCFSENTLVAHVVDAPADLYAAARDRALELEADLGDEGSDPLEIERDVEIPDLGLGQFELTLVSDAYFALRDQALSVGDFGRGHQDYLRGLSFEALGRPEAAVPCLEKALRQNAGDPDMNLAIGRSLSTMAEHDRALPFLEKACESQPECAEAQNALGLALYRTGKRTKARTAFERAVRLSPTDVSFLVNLGRTCAEEDLFTEAKAALDRALRMDPCSPEAHASMALLCHKLGDSQAAMRHAREALSEAPDDDTVRELLTLIGADDD